MFSKYGNCTRLLKIKNKLKIGCTNEVCGLWAFLITQLFHSRSYDDLLIDHLQVNIILPLWVFLSYSNLQIPAKALICTRKPNPERFWSDPRSKMPHRAHGLLGYSRFSHDVTKIQTKKLSILLSF